MLRSPQKAFGTPVHTAWGITCLQNVSRGQAEAVVVAWQADGEAAHGAFASLPPLRTATVETEGGGGR